MTTPIYLVNLKSPTRQIVQRPAELVMRKLGWAQANGRRYLLGASAFQTEASARRAKLALLVKQSKVEWLIRRNSMLIDMVHAQLKDPNHRGWQVRVVK